MRNLINTATKGNNISKGSTVLFRIPQNPILGMLLLLFFSNSLFAQSPYWLPSDSLKVEFAWQSMELLKTDTSGKWVVDPAKYIVVIKLRQDQVAEINSWDAKQWRRNLKNKRSGYITNLLLNAKNNRDATLSKVNSENYWKLQNRKKELRYWRKFLKQNGKDGKLTFDSSPTN